MDAVTILCYWGGTTYDGPDGISYSKAPKKAINVNSRIQFDELIDPIYRATSFDKQHHRINLTCKYPSVGIGNGIGNAVTYIPLLHQEVSNIDLYLEVEDNVQILHTKMGSRNHESVVLEQERNNELLLPHMRHANVISDMIQNEDFYTISQVAVMSNGMISDNEIDEEDGIGEEYDEEDGIDITCHLFLYKFFHRYCLRHFINNFNDKFRNS